MYNTWIYFLLMRGMILLCMGMNLRNGEGVKGRKLLIGLSNLDNNSQLKRDWLAHFFEVIPRRCCHVTAFAMVCLEGAQPVRLVWQSSLHS